MFLGVSHVRLPLQGDGTPALLSFGSSFLFMPTPIGIERPNSVWQRIWEGPVLGVSQAAAHCTNASDSLSAIADFLVFCVIVYNRQ